MNPGRGVFDDHAFSDVDPDQRSAEEEGLRVRLAVSDVLAGHEDRRRDGRGSQASLGEQEIGTRDHRPRNSVFLEKSEEIMCTRHRHHSVEILALGNGLVRAQFSEFLRSGIGEECANGLDRRLAMEDFESISHAHALGPLSPGAHGGGA